MSRFNTRDHQALPQVALATSPLTTNTKAPDTRTYQGAQGWSRTPQAELFLRATGGLHGGVASFYEDGKERDDRLRELTRHVAREDPKWCLEFARWLRTDGNIRTGALMFAVEFVHERLAFLKEQDPGYTDPHAGINRAIIRVVCRRADEPGEILAIWTAWFGKRIPQPVKRALADAARRRYNECSLLKYDTASRAYRFADVINLCHPVPKELVGEPRWFTDFSTGKPCPHPDKVRFASWWIHPGLQEKAPHLRSYLCRCGWYHLTSQVKRNSGTDFTSIERQAKRLFIAASTPQGNLFKYAIDRRYGRELDPRLELPIVRAQIALRQSTDPNLWLNPEVLAAAGMTWEDALSAMGSKVDKAKLWEAMIPSMGIFALVRNLRNFDEAGVSNTVAQQVIDKLTDPEVIAESRMFPFRFLAAHRATKDAGSLRWGHALDQALNLSLASVPSLGGRTLILVDRSPSMFKGYYTPNETDKRLGMDRADQAALFGTALALRAEKPSLVQFGGTSSVVPLLNYSSLLPAIENFGEMIPYTDIAGALQRHFKGHDQVVIITDEQTRPGHVASVSAGGWRGEVSLKELVSVNTPVFMWNLGGYTASAAPAGSDCWFSLGGLTDQAFAMIPQLLAGASGGWPWEQEPQGM